MTKDEDFKLLKIQHCVLRVNIHCDGCQHKVKKLLQRIEGVYQVKIDGEQQKVTVSGSVDSATLIRKLIRAGKHAEIWSHPKPNNQNQKHKISNLQEADSKKNKGQKPGGVRDLDSLRNKQLKLPFMSDLENDCRGDEGFGTNENHGMQLLREKMNQLAMLKKQAEALAPGNLKNNPGKKSGNPNHQNIGMKANPGSANVHDPDLAKRGNEINSMMNLGGFHGNGGFQVQQGNSGGLLGSTGGFPMGGMATGQGPGMMVNVDGNLVQQHQHNLAPLMGNNLQSRHGWLQQQPQMMMYNRSPFIPPTTGYYYYDDYAACHGPGPGPLADSNGYEYGGGGGGSNSQSVAHIFSDENPSSCSVM